jgi:hypothetical protein
MAMMITPAQWHQRPVNDNDMTTSRKIAVLERSVERMLGDLDEATDAHDGRRQVALMTLIRQHQRRIFELYRGF